MFLSNINSSASKTVVVGATEIRGDVFACKIFLTFPMLVLLSLGRLLLLINLTLIKMKMIYN